MKRFGLPVLVFAALTCLLMAGCGGGGVVPVEGTVSYEGAPVPGISLVFSPEDGSRQSSGSTDENGNFKLMYTIDEMGALPGKHNVAFEWEAGEPGVEPSEAIAAILKAHGEGGTPYKVEITGATRDLKIELPQASAGE